jgi:hypothetical protein
MSEQDPDKPHDFEAILDGFKSCKHCYRKRSAPVHDLQFDMANESGPADWLDE